MARGEQIDHLYCVHCGTNNKIELPIDGKPNLGPCTKCKLFTVSPFALLLALGLHSDESNPCPSCKRQNSINHAWCFACGQSFKS